jgi:peptidyl-prolyl cis-trans isomerase SurA
MLTPTTASAASVRLAVALAACVLAACGGAGTSSPSAPAADVWAVVDGREIRRDDVDLAFRRTAPATATPSDEEILAAKLSILDQLIDQELLLARAQALNLAVADDELDKAFNERRSNLSDDAFQKELAQRRVTVDDMRQALRRDLLIQKLVDREIASRITVTDQEIRDFFEKNRSQFYVPETQHRIAQIIITPVKEAQLRNRLNHDATSPAEAQKKFELIAARLKEGADFATLAREYSEDPQSAPGGGDLGFIPASSLDKVPPRLREIVIKTEPGNISTISDGGAHTFVMVLAREQAGQRTLDTPSVREGISDALRERREQLLRAAYIAAARDRADITNYLARSIADAKTIPPALLAAPK